MTDHAEVLIIGAGPTGLAAALFLAESGHHPRLIERMSERSPWSKAFGVNARTLSLLSQSGVTSRYLANGRRLERLNLHRRGRILATLRLNEVEDRFPFLLVQSQADSERLIETALAERGIIVERGVEAVSARKEGGKAVVEIQSGETRSAITADCVLEAGGAGSLVRKSLGISFDGESYADPWRVYDVELEDLPMPRDEANIVLHDQGGLFLVRHHDNLWRVLGNVPEMLSQLPVGTKVGKIHWESDFGISNRVAGRFADPPFYLAGDAAHIHSGIGARGMNLGIEDAYVFAELYRRGQLDRYDRLRRPIVEKVVGQIKRAMGPPRPATAPGRIVRAAPWLVPIIIGLIRKPAQQWILGLDHELGL